MMRFVPLISGPQRVFPERRREKGFNNSEKRFCPRLTEQNQLSLRENLGANEVSTRATALPKGLRRVAQRTRQQPGRSLGNEDRAGQWNSPNSRHLLNELCRTFRTGRGGPGRADYKVPSRSGSDGRDRLSTLLTSNQDFFRA
jgi:hypothetical protein